MEFQSLVSLLVLYLKGSSAFCFFLFLPVISVSTWYVKRKSKCALGYWPLLGNLPSLFWNSNRQFEWVTQIFISLGKSSFYIKGPIFTKLSYLITCDPQNMEYILKTNFNNFPKGPGFKQVFDILGDGIFTVDSDLWRVQRRMAHASFSSAEFRALVAKTSRNIVEDQLIPLLAHAAKQGSIVDLQDVCLRFAYDSNMSTIVGNNERYLSVELPSNEFAEATDDAQEAIYMRHVMPTFLWKSMHSLGIGRERKLANASKTVDRIFEKCISEKRQDLLKGIETFDILSSYIKSGKELSNKYLRDAMLNLAAAGKDAIASGLIWFLWVVYTTPIVEMKILEELNNLVRSLKNKRDDSNDEGDESDDTWPWVFNSEDLKGLVYLHAALCESLRLYPPVPLNSKAVLKEDMLPDGTKVKPGMQILLSMYSVGRMPWIWGEDCLEFKPQRWIDSDTGKQSQECMSKFFSFNAGPRSCLGKDMSLTQMKSAVAAVLFNFHVEVMEGHHVCTRPAINLQMKNGLMVKVKKRLSIVK